jgi:hypothetical protein
MHPSLSLRVTSREKRCVIFVEIARRYGRGLYRLVPFVQEFLLWLRLQEGPDERVYQFGFLVNDPVAAVRNSVDRE